MSPQDSANKMMSYPGATNVTIKAMVATAQHPPAAYSDIIRVNLGLAKTEEEQVTEWELGKNECAAARH